MDFKQTNADLWKAAGGRPLANPSSFSKEFDAAMERANRREISPMADIYNPNMNSLEISSHKNPDGSSVVAYANGETVTYDANGNYTGRTAGNDTRGLGSMPKQNTATGNSSDNSGNGLGGLTDMFKGDQSRAGSAVDMMLQAGFPPFMIMRNIKAFFEPEYDKGTAVGMGRDFLGRGEEETTTPGNMNVDYRGVLANDPVGLAGVGNVPGQGGYRYGNVDNVGWEDPNNEGYNFGGREYVDDYQGSGQAVYDPNYDYSQAASSEGGNSANYNTGGGDNYGMTGEAGSGFGGFAEGTDAEDAASADAGYWQI